MRLHDFHVRAVVADGEFRRRGPAELGVVDQHDDAAVGVGRQRRVGGRERGVSDRQEAVGGGVPVPAVVRRVHEEAEPRLVRAALQRGAEHGVDVVAVEVRVVREPARVGAEVVDQLRDVRVEAGLLDRSIALREDHDVVELRARPVADDGPDDLGGSERRRERQDGESREEDRGLHRCPSSRIAIAARRAVPKGRVRPSRSTWNSMRSKACPQSGTLTLTCAS